MAEGQSSGVDVKHLFQSNFAYIFAKLHLTKFGDRPIAQEALHNLFLSEFTDIERPGFVLRNAIAIIAHLLQSADFGEDCSRPYYSIKVVVKAIEGLPDQSTHDENRNILFSQILKDEKFATILNRLHSNASQCRHEIECGRPLASVAAFILLVQDKAYEASNFRYLIHILLGFLRFRSQDDKVCKLLYGLIKPMFENGAFDDLGPLLQQILFGLTATLQTDVDSNSRMKDDSPIVNLIIFLTEKAPQGLHRYLKHVEPLPENRLFNKARLLHQEIRKDVKIWEVLENFSNRLSVMPSELRMHSLRTLNQQIESSKAEVQAEFATSDPDTRHKLQSLTWTIAHQACELGSMELQSFAGRLLALMGPLPNETIAFTNRDLPHSLDSKKPKSAEAFDLCCVSILQHLSSCLVDESPALIADAQTALCMLLQNDPMKHAMDKLDRGTKSYISIYQHSTTSDKPDFKKQRSEPGWQLENNNQLWKVGQKGYSVWVSNFAYTLLLWAESDILQCCHRMVQLMPKLAELLLPHIFLLEYPHTCGKCLVQAIHLQGLTSHVCEINLAIYETSTFLGYFGTSLQVYWLDLDYLDTAAAALRCSALLSALQYLEEWSLDAQDAIMLPQSVVKQGQEVNHKRAQNMMVDIYCKIGDPDSIYAGMNSSMSRLPLLEREGKWDQLLIAQSFEYKEGSFELAQAHFNVLYRMNCMPLANVFLKGLQRDLNDESDPEHRIRRWATDAQCQAAWELGQWDDAPFDQYSSPDAARGFNNTISTCLKLLQSGSSEDHFERLIQEARSNLVLSMHENLIQVASLVNPDLLHLQMLETLSEAWSMPKIADSLPTPLETELAVKKTDLWITRCDEAGSGWRFDLGQPLQALTKAVINSKGHNERLMPVCLLQGAIRARKAKRLPHAAEALWELSRLSGSSQLDWSLETKLESAKLLWAEQSHNLAIQSLQDIMNSSQNWSVWSSKAKTLRAKWQGMRRSEKPAKIFETLQEASDYMGELRNHVHADTFWYREAARVEYRLAQYANKLYINIEARMRSPEQIRTREFMDKQSKEFKEGQKQLVGKDRESTEFKRMNVQLHRLLGQIKLDELRQCQMEKNCATYLISAIKAFVRCLKLADDYNIPAMHRTIQLWLHLSGDASVNKELKTAIRDVSSYKFLILDYQIAARLSHSLEPSQASSAFQENLFNLMARLGTDHPFHAMYPLLSLSNGNRMDDGTIASTDNVLALQQGMDANKIRGANRVIDRIASKPHRAKIVEQMKELVDGYIKLAALPMRAGKPLDSAWRRRMSGLNLLPVITQTLQPDQSCRYDDIAVIQGFGSKMTNPGGINAPKLIECTDSRGHKYRQLVKSGRDDLRQDAVMQQFFSLVNHTLENSEATSQRHLKIRQFKVVPFSPFAGIIGFVENTMPIGAFLLGGEGKPAAHVRYRPGDWSIDQQRKRLFMERKAGRDCLPIYNQIVEHIKPVMHYFFLEQFCGEAEWFEKRLSYTRSIAVTSMAGYLIGLGDRHLNNMLIDKRTADVIHIDLGIAFEQGRFLSTPELVPFRLTRDIIDGMGITGIEGTMRKCCEETMRVLRQNKDLFLTIVEVFIHDPLYAWALTAKRALQRQRDVPEDDAQVEQPEEGQERIFVGQLPDGNSNADAERAVQRIRHKLEGVEEGADEALSVEGQVQQLFVTAQDPENLARIFSGWLAFC